MTVSTTATRTDLNGVYERFGLGDAQIALATNREDRFLAASAGSKFAHSDCQVWPVWDRPVWEYTAGCKNCDGFPSVIAMQFSLLPQQAHGWPHVAGLDEVMGADLYGHRHPQGWDDMYPVHPSR